MCSIGIAGLPAANVRPVDNVKSVNSVEKDVAKVGNSVFISSLNDQIRNASVKGDSRVEVSPSLSRPSADWDPEKAVEHAE